MNAGLKQLLQVITILGVFAGIVAAYWFLSASMSKDSGNVKYVGVVGGVILALVLGGYAFKQFRIRGSN